MNGARGVLEQLERERLLAIVRTDDPDEGLTTVAGLVDGGVRIAEISLSAPGALRLVAAATERFGDALTLGAGTVRSVTQARAALAAGARFLVAPGFSEAVTAFAAEHDVLHLPGVLTPTEIGAALAAGAPALKLFPAGRLGPGYVADLRGPFPGLRLVATGGVDAGNAAAFLAAGCAAVALGGALSPEPAPVTVAAVADRARHALESLSPHVKDAYAN